MVKYKTKLANFTSYFPPRWPVIFYFEWCHCILMQLQWHHNIILWPLATNWPFCSNFTWIL